MDCLVDRTGDGIPAEIVEFAPDDGARLRRADRAVAVCVKSEDQVVVEVKRLIAVGRDGVNVDIDDGRAGIDMDSGFFEDFASGRRGEARIGRLDVSAGEKPPVKARVVDEENAPVIGAKHEACRGDVTRIKMIAGAGVGRVLEEREDEVKALASFTVVLGVEGAEGVEDVLCLHWQVAEGCGTPLTWYCPPVRCESG